ncbi:hypothetical protein ACNOYE_03245 [Nannocystaceae bacterium ST9]
MTEQATAGLIGCIDLQLDSIATDARAELLAVLPRIRRRIEEEPDLLAAVELNRRSFGSGTHFTDNVDPEQLSTPIDAMMCLIRGEWRWSAEDPEALPKYWLSSPA